MVFEKSTQDFNIKSVFSDRILGRFIELLLYDILTLHWKKLAIGTEKNQQTIFFSKHESGQTKNPQQINYVNILEAKYIVPSQDI
jgi:hypothetical protein